MLRIAAHVHLSCEVVQCWWVGVEREMGTRGWEENKRDAFTQSPFGIRNEVLQRYIYFHNYYFPKE